MSDESASPAGSAPTEIGAALTAAREARGLSVEDVAASTRIRATVIRAIERDDFSRSGGAAYARGHIRSIAHVVDLDPQPLVDEFDRQHEGAVPVLAGGPVPALGPAPDLRTVSRPSPRWATAAIGVLVIVMGFLLVSWLLGRNSTPTSSATGAATTTSGPPAAATTPPVTTAPPTTPPSTTSPPGVTLRVTAATGDSWLRVVSSSGANVYEGILGMGQARSFRDSHQLTVTFGYSPGVTLMLNGQPVGAPRCDAIVCTLQFQPAGATAG